MWEAVRYGIHREVLAMKRHAAAGTGSIGDGRFQAPRPGGWKYQDNPSHVEHAGDRCMGHEEKGDKLKAQE